MASERIDLLAQIAHVGERRTRVQIQKQRSWCTVLWALDFSRPGQGKQYVPIPNLQIPSSLGCILPFQTMRLGMRDASLAGVEEHIGMPLANVQKRVSKVVLSEVADDIT